MHLQIQEYHLSPAQSFILKRLLELYRQDEAGHDDVRGHTE